MTKLYAVMARASWFVFTLGVRIAAALTGALLRRRRRVAVFTVLVGVLAVGAASPAAADPSTKSVNPEGLSGLLVPPDLQGSNSPTLFEAYSPDLFTHVDSDLGTTDLVEKAATFLVECGLTVLVLFIRGCLVITEWIMTQHLFADLIATVGNGITKLGDAVFWPLFPVSLAAGAVAAYAAHRRSGSGVNEFTWLIATGLVAIAFMTQPVRFLDDMNDTRVKVAAATSGALANATDTTLAGPIEPPKPATFVGDPSVNATRKMADSIWRTYVVTPWCLEEFGSRAMCQAYGATYLQDVMKGGNEQLLMNAVRNDHSETSSNTSTWMVGKDVGGRLGVMLLSLIIALPFAVFLLALAIAALMAVVFVCAIAVLGVLFLLCWPIRGRLRQVGTRWVEHLIGGFIQSFAVTTVLGVTLLISAGILSLSGQYGFAITGIINVAAALCAFRYRRLFETMAQLATPGHASPAVGLAAMQAAAFGGRLLGKAMPHPKIPQSWRQQDPPDRRGREASDPSAPSTGDASLRRVYRPQPAPAAILGRPGRPSLPGGPAGVPISPDPVGPKPLSGGAAVALHRGDPPSAAHPDVGSHRPRSAGPASEFAAPQPELVGSVWGSRAEDSSPAGRSAASSSSRATQIRPTPRTDIARPVGRRDPQMPAGPRRAAKRATGRPVRRTEPARSLPPVIDVTPARVREEVMSRV